MTDGRYSTEPQFLAYWVYESCADRYLTSVACHSESDMHGSLMDSFLAQALLNKRPKLSLCLHWQCMHCSLAH